MKYLFAFSLGAAVGSVATWAVLKNRYEQLAQEDAQSVREAYMKKYGDLKDDEGEDENEYAKWAEENPSEAEVEREEYNSLASYYNRDSEEGGSESMNIDKPRVILPREFEEIDDYETISLNYYADGVLADDMDEIVEDVENTVGDFKDHFGEYENDTVYVRNDRLRCYYEICADDRNYYDVADTDPVDED